MTTSTMPEPTAAWPVHSLMTSLANAGWGIISGREFQGFRSTLHALEYLLPRKSGIGEGTVFQIALRSGLSERWTRECLYAMEDMGLVQWTRGTIVDGRPTPGRFKIVKSVLVRLIRIARGTISRRLEEHKRALLARLRQLRKVTLPRYKREKPGNQAALDTDLTTSKRGEAPSASASPVDNSTSKETKVIRPPSPRPELMPRYCPHEGSSARSVIYTCDKCRSRGITAEDWAEYDAALLEESRRAETVAPVELTLEEELLTQTLNARYPGLHPAKQMRMWLADKKAGLVA